LFGHYDVDHVEPEWDTPPFRLTQREGRWFGLGIADNKGALAARLHALRALDACPQLTWIIQGEEESGSGALKGWLAKSGLPQADWYLDENGWADAEGSQRVLACRITHEQRVPLSERETTTLMELLSVGWSKRHVEPRMLNKHLVPGGCAFQAALKEGARYLGIGTNDSATKIHAPNESIPESGVVRHVSGLVAFLGAVARGDL
jgi:acetylornithine deacetylase/succinyl-diaminopimelate desuccinylase-like protein